MGWCNPIGEFGEVLHRKQNMITQINMVDLCKCRLCLSHVCIAMCNGFRVISN